MKNLLFVFIFFLSYALSWAEVPKQISWQGVLTDVQGNALQGQNQIIVKIFASDDAINDLNPLWTETYNLNLSDGLVNLTLGENIGNPININFNQGLWLEIVINGGNPLNRIQLTSVPYSMMSKDIEEGRVVRSLGKVEQLKDDIRLVEGENVTIEDNTPNENDIRISALPELRIEQNIDNSISIFVWNNVTNVYNLWIIILHTGEVWWFRELVIYETLIVKHEESERSVEITADEGITLRGPDGQITGRWNTDGTSEHSGMETFLGGITIIGEDGGSTVMTGDETTTTDADGNSTTTNGEGTTHTATDQNGTTTTTSSAEGTSTTHTDNEGESSSTDITSSGFEHTAKDGSKIIIDSEGIICYDSEGNVMFEFRSDGTSSHSGLETFSGGISVPSPAGGGLTITPGGGLESSSPDSESGVKVKENDGDIIFEHFTPSGSFTSDDDGLRLEEVSLNFSQIKFNYDGTSEQTGLGTFKAGLEVPLTGGGNMFFLPGAVPLEISSLNGNDVFTISNIGATEQSGLGVFHAGLEVPLTVGGTLELSPGIIPISINNLDGHDIFELSFDGDELGFQLRNENGELLFGGSGIVITNTEDIVATVNYDGSSSFSGLATYGNGVTVLNAAGNKRFEFNNDGLFIYNNAGNCLNFQGPNGNSLQLGLAQFGAGLQVTNGTTQLKNTTISGDVTSTGTIQASTFVCQGQLTVNNNTALGGDCSVDGNHTVTGDLNVTGEKNFRIDYPDDPYNKYLFHASIESDEVLNQYSGNVVTDASGYAIVTLPDYVQKINIDFRYQLTVIGDFAQAIISKKIQDNQFEIRTDKANIEVSWQITAKRNDSVLKNKPFKAVREKSGTDKGKLLYNTNNFSN